MTTHNPPEFQGITTFFVLWRVLRYFYDNDTTPILSKGYLGEDFLFILNAFVFALAPLKVKQELTPKSYLNHLAKTLIHIYPILLISELSLYFFFDHINRGDRCTTANLVDHFSLIQVWTDPKTCNRLSWSLALEWAGAVVFPFLHWIFQNKTNVTYFFCALTSYIGLVAAWGSYQWTSLNLIQGYNAHIRFFTQSLIGYCLGSLYKLDRHRSILYDLLTIGCIGLTVSCSGTDISTTDITQDDIFLVILLSALPFCLIKSLYQRQFFSTPLLRVLGEISMTVLFTHGLVGEYARQYWRTTSANLFIYLCLCYILGYVVYTYYEAPVTKFLHSATIFGEDVEEYREANGEGRVNGYQEVRPEGSLRQSNASQGTGLMFNSLEKEKNE